MELGIRLGLLFGQGVDVWGQINLRRGRLHKLVTWRLTKQRIFDGDSATPCLAAAAETAANLRQLVLSRVDKLTTAAAAAWGKSFCTLIPDKTDNND